MVRTRRFRVETRGHTDVVDITGQVAVGLSGNGLATVFVDFDTRRRTRDVTVQVIGE